MDESTRKIIRKLNEQIMCLYPTMGINKRYTETKKNGGVIPAVYDKRAMAIPYACGNCMECRKQKAREWKVRLQEDIKDYKNGIMITLTFSTESLIKIIEEHPTPLDGYERENWIVIKAMHLFRERWRKKYKKSPRHWTITELGGGRYEHIHIHGIIWTDRKIINKKDVTGAEIKKIWQYGHVWIGDYVNERTINYMVKYVHKMDLKHQKYKPIVLTSPGIGANYITSGRHKCNHFKEGETQETYRTRSGHLIAMPSYWRKKIYTDEEREMLWMNLLDKQERWVGGEKIDISKGEETYFKILNYYQKKNKKLGYGDKEKKWNREVYERERRNAIWNERTNSTNNVRSDHTRRK